MVMDNLFVIIIDGLFICSNLIILVDIYFNDDYINDLIND